MSMRDIGTQFPFDVFVIMGLSNNLRKVPISSIS